MKKVINTLLGILIFTEIHTIAQTNHIGLSAGIDIAKAYYTNFPEVANSENAFDPMLSYSLNFCWLHKSSGFWGFSVEPGFIQKGGMDKNDNRAKFNYIQLPVLGDFYLTKSLFISIGPEIAYMINDKYHAFSHRFELSGMAGFGVDFGDRISVALRYSHGLTSIITVDWTDLDGHSIGGTSKLYNQYGQVVIRYNLKPGT